MPKWAKWLSLIGTGFLSGLGSAQLTGAGNLKGSLINGAVAAGVAALGGWTETNKAGISLTGNTAGTTSKTKGE